LTISLELRKRQDEFYRLLKNKKLSFNEKLIASGKIKKPNLTYLQETSKNLLLSSIIGTDKNKDILTLNFDKILEQIKKKKPKKITKNGFFLKKKFFLL